MERLTAGSPLPVAPWHMRTVEEVEERLQTSGHGLSRAEASARVAQHGPNRLEDEPPTSAPVVLLRQFRSPLIYILVAALGVTVLLGDRLDAAVIGVVLVVNAVVGFTQERKAEGAVRALMGLVVPHARVVRAGQEWELDSSELVPGDVVLLESGARVPADLRLRTVNALQIDESLLTGESAVVSKGVDPVEERRTLAERSCMAYAGSIVASGRASGIVVATGGQTELGAIAGLIRDEEAPPTPLQQRMDSFAKLIGAAVAAASAVAFVSGVAVGESVDDMFLVAVSLAVSAVPEGLPVAVTITLAVGVGRMARRHAIIRRLAAVETLGSTTVIGSDKTGTLTENHMTVEAVWTAGHRYAFVGGIPDGEFLEADEPVALGDGSALHLALLAGVLANEAEAYRRDGTVESTGDPTEVALLTAAMSAGIEPDEARGNYPLFAEIPFEPARKYSASVRAWHGDQALFVKGAPERIATMCTSMVTDEGVVALEVDQVHEAAAELAGQGLRVLALAYRPVDGPSRTATALDDPSDLVFLGLQGMMDPPRAGMRAAIDACREAGIRVIMITGDHAVTAAAIAQQLGIQTSDRVVTGPELDQLDDAQVRAAVANVAVFAAGLTGAEAAHRRSAAGARQRGCGDRRRSQRRTCAQGRADRGRDGTGRHRCRA